MPRLTKRQEKFVDKMIDPEITSPKRAAIEAGYSPDSAAVIASENLNKPYILEAIEKRKADAALFANVTGEQVIGATAQRAYATIDDAFDENGNFSIVKARETGAVHLIKKLTKTRTKYGENIAVEFYSNESAQDRLGQYLGLEKLPDLNPNTVKDAEAALIDILTSHQAAHETYETLLSLMDTGRYDDARALIVANEPVLPGNIREDVARAWKVLPDQLSMSEAVN